MDRRVNPTFLLKGISHTEILKKYKKGLFNEQIKNIIQGESSYIGNIYNNNDENGIFTIKDKNNESLTIATTGYKNYVVYNTSGGNLAVGGICEHCREKYTCTSVGYPVAYKEITVLSQKEGKDVNIILYCFWVEGDFCSFECCAGYLQCGISMYGKDFCPSESTRYLRLWYKLAYPNEGELRALPHYRLLEKNGGSVSTDDWKKHKYQKTVRVSICPIRTEYILDGNSQYYITHSSVPSSNIDSN